MLTSDDYLIVEALGDTDGVRPFSHHSMVRLKQRRTDVSFEEAVTDVVHAWTHGIDLGQNNEHMAMLRSLVKHYNLRSYRYVMYQGYLYVFNKTRVLITILYADRMNQEF